MAEIHARFLSLHRPGSPLLLPNAWDPGSARLMEELGAQAVASTSSGFAATLGRPDGDVDAAHVLAHARALVEAVGVPVSADLEDGYAATLDALAATYTAAQETGLAGASLEDWSGERLYEPDEAAERVAAAREAAPDLVLTARAEGFLRERPDLAEVIARLQAYVEAGAQVAYAPGIADLTQLRTLAAEVPAPVNVLLLPGMSLPAVADAGAARVSVGGQLAWTAWAGAAAATREFLAGGTDWLERAVMGRRDAAAVIDRP